MTAQTCYFAEFMGANGRVRYVGHGATMPFDPDHARPFEARKDAAAALKAIHAAHKGGTYERIRARRVTLAKPAFMLALGL